jgi:hypothetical protein
MWEMREAHIGLHRLAVSRHCHLEYNMRSRWNCLVVGSCNVFGLALLVLSAAGGGSAVRAEDPATLPGSVLEKITAGIEQRVADLQASVAAFADSFTARRITAQELCVSDASGAQTCITKAQLDALIRGTVQTGQAPAAIEPDQTQQTAAADKSDAPVALVVPPPETTPVTEPSGAPLAVPPAQAGERRGGKAAEAMPEVVAVPEAAALREVEAVPEVPTEAAAAAEVQAAPEVAAAPEVETVPETTAAIPSATQPTTVQPAAASREAGAPLAEVPSQPSAPAETVIAASAKSQSIAEERAVKDEDPVQRGSTETTSPPEAAPAQAAPVSQRVE